MQLKRRFVAYKDVETSVGMRLERLKRLMLNLALTVKVHPSALGIKAEAGGQVSNPAHRRIEMNCITDVFKYHDRHRTNLPAQNFNEVRKLSIGLHSIPNQICGWL